MGSGAFGMAPAQAGLFLWGCVDSLFSLNAIEEYRSCWEEGEYINSFMARKRTPIACEERWKYVVGQGLFKVSFQSTCVLDYSE